MSTTTPTTQNQEMIEAKLCAYIDGELDLEGRTEIERHLEANPQHRRLLESLKATKDLVRWLPREPAPPEVAETLNGQLERSVLLDYDGDSLRPHIWPRFMAAAAIVLLTAGLAAAVYFALPRSQKNATPYAFHVSETPGGMTPAATPADLPQNESERADASDLARKEATITQAPAAPPQLAAIAAPPAADEPSRDLDRLARDVVQNRSAYVAAANQTAQIAPMRANNAIVMLVRSDAPTQTERQLTRYLDAQKIQWKQAGAAGPALMLEQQTARPRHSDLSDETGSRSLALEDVGNGVYVARMSRQQARQLNLTIGQAQPGAGERQFASSMTPATQLSEPQDRAISDAVPQWQVTPPAAALGATTEPSSQPAGLLPESPDAAKRPAVARSSAPPAMVPPAAALAPATEPTTQPAAQAIASTQPNEAAVDVVILVQPNPAAASEPAATQPAPGPQPAEINTQIPQTQPAR